MESPIKKYQICRKCQLCLNVDAFRPTHRSCKKCNNKNITEKHKLDMKAYYIKNGTKLLNYQNELNRMKKTLIIERYCNTDNFSSNIQQDGVF